METTEFRRKKKDREMETLDLECSESTIEEVGLVRMIRRGRSVRGDREREEPQSETVRKALFASVRR